MQCYNCILIILFIIVIVGVFVYRRHEKSNGGMAGFQMTSTQSHKKCGAIASMHFLCTPLLRTTAKDNLQIKVASKRYLQSAIDLLDQKCENMLHPSKGFEFSELIGPNPEFYDNYALGKAFGYLAFISEALNIHGVHFMYRNPENYDHDGALSKPGVIYNGQLPTLLGLIRISFTRGDLNFNKKLKQCIISLLLLKENICPQFIMEEKGLAYGGHASTFILMNIEGTPPFWLHYPDEYDPEERNHSSVGYTTRGFIDKLNKDMGGILMLMPAEYFRLFAKITEENISAMKIAADKNRMDGLSETAYFSDASTATEYAKKRKEHPELPYVPHKTEADMTEEEKQQLTEQYIALAKQRPRID